MTTPRSALRFLLAAALLTVVASCVESKHPLSDEKTSRIDERLIGTWLPDGERDGWQLKKSARVENALELTIRGLQSGKPLVFTTTIKSKGYLSIKDMVPSQKSEGARYDIYQYVFLDKDTLQVWDMEPKVIEKAIADKTLGGEPRLKKTKTRRFLGIFKIETVEETEAVITASPQAIARYLEAHADECYPSKTDAALTWKRQK